MPAFEMLKNGQKFTLGLTGMLLAGGLALLDKLTDPVAYCLIGLLAVATGGNVASKAADGLGTYLKNKASKEPTQ